MKFTDIPSAHSVNASKKSEILHVIKYQVLDSSLLIRPRSKSYIRSSLSSRERLARISIEIEQDQT